MRSARGIARGRVLLLRLGLRHVLATLAENMLSPPLPPRLATRRRRPRSFEFSDLFRGAAPCDFVSRLNRGLLEAT
jgi:hypothetical protein